MDISLREVLCMCLRHAPPQIRMHSLQLLLDHLSVLQLLDQPHRLYTHLLECSIHSKIHTHPSHQLLDLPKLILMHSRLQPLDLRIRMVTSLKRQDHSQLTLMFSSLQHQDLGQKVKYLVSNSHSKVLS